jgi:hypothetical protein
MYDVNHQARHGAAKGNEMNFNEWFDQADMPEIVNGEWIDMETGIPFSAWQPAKRATRKPVALEINGKPAKVAEGLAYVARLASNQAKAMERATVRNAESPNLAAYLVAANAAIEAVATLSSKSKKAEIAAAIRLNQAASRVSNTL